MCEDSTLALFSAYPTLFFLPPHFSQSFEHGLGFVKGCGNSRDLNRWPSLSGALSVPLPRGVEPKRALSFQYDSWMEEKTDPRNKRGPIYGAPAVISYLFTWQASCSHCIFFCKQFRCGIEILGRFSLTLVLFVSLGLQRGISMKLICVLMSQDLIAV